MLVENWDNYNKEIQSCKEIIKFIENKCSIKEENNIIYTENEAETEVIEGIYGKFGNNTYQVDLFFVRNRGNIAKLFIYLKRHDGNWKDKMDKLCEKSDDWEENGYKLKWSNLDWFMPEDMFRRRIEIARKRWKKLKRTLDEMGKPRGRA
jgi:hypothetical protein